MECTGRRYDSRAVSLHGLVRKHAWIRHGPVDHVAPHSAVTPVHFIYQNDTATTLALTLANHQHQCLHITFLKVVFAQFTVPLHPPVLELGCM